MSGDPNGRFCLRGTHGYKLLSGNLMATSFPPPLNFRVRTGGTCAMVGPKTAHTLHVPVPRSTIDRGPDHARLRAPPLTPNLHIFRAHRRPQCISRTALSAFFRTVSHFRADRSGRQYRRQARENV